MYTPLCGLLPPGLPTCSSFERFDGVAEGVLASGRPAKGLLRPATPGLWCDTV
jgi:hypothetical protein